MLSRADGPQITNFQTRDNRTALQSNTGNTFVCRPCRSHGYELVAAGRIRLRHRISAGPDGRGDNSALQYAPLGGQFRTQDYDRRASRHSLWPRPVESTDLIGPCSPFQYLRTESTNSWGEHTFEAAPDLSQSTTPIRPGCHQNGGTERGRAPRDCRINAAGQFFFTGNDRGNGYTGNRSTPRLRSQLRL